jgi:class 3 adenylate cyclase/tetratricopeptide (TPR) repeat protein
MAACPNCGAENPDGARFCNACGSPLPESAPAVAGEVRKTVTVIFCDVTGSTALGDRLDPEAVRRLMSRYFAAMTEAIERHGGTVEKFIGDAVMAVFGIPITYEDDALRAVRAAGDMREALRLLNKELERDHGATLVCRIGVNTGEVVAGETSARQALVTGDAVNVAARLEQAATPGEVLIADATLRLVRDAVVTDAVAPLDLKGKSEPVTAHRLLAVHAGAAGIARRLDSPLVGRQRPLAQLLQAFEDVVADRVCHLFTILGPPGVGKSRLVQEALVSLAERATIVRGRCLSYGEGITFWPLVEIVRDVVGADPGDVADSIVPLLPDDPSASEVATRVAQLVGGQTGLALPAEEVGWAVRRFLEGLALTRPLVVVLDDLQWAEPSLLDLVDQVTDWSRDAPILVICMARPDLLDTRSDWGGGKLHATTVALEPLSPEEAERLVDNLVGGVGVSARARIVEAAEGNPLFAEETVAMLVDDGVIRREGDRWVAATDLERVSVPPTIQALLAARLDRLDDAERALLGRAAVVGQVFYLGAIRELGPEAERNDTGRLVQQLVRRDLVRPAASDLVGEEAFRFHHGLLADAAYQMLPKEERAVLHERLADWLAARPGMADADEFVGFHLEQAYRYRGELGPDDERSHHLATRAAERLSAAASRAIARSDTAATENLSRRAAALRAPDDPQRAWDLMALGWILGDADRAREMAETFDEALALAETTGDERAIAHASLGATFGRWLVAPEGGSDAIAALLDQVLPQLEAWADDQGLAIAYVCRSQIHWNACRFEEARRDCARAVPHAHAADDGTFERIALVTGAIAGALGPASADQILEDVEELQGRATVYPSLRLMSIDLTSAVHALRGNFDEARRLHDEELAVARELLGRVPSGFYEASWRLETLADDHAAAEMWAGRGYDQLASFGDHAHASTQAIFRGVSCYLLGRFDEARRYAAAGREMSASDDAINQYSWRSVEAKLLTREGRIDDAVRLIREAVQLAETTDEFLLRWLLCWDRADVAIAAGDPREARAALEQAVERAERKGAVVLVDRARRRLAEL